jgi:hypothetical protein
MGFLMLNIQKKSLLPSLGLPVGLTVAAFLLSGSLGCR